MGRKTKKLGLNDVNADESEFESGKINFVKAYIFSEEKNNWEEMKADSLLS